MSMGTPRDHAPTMSRELGHSHLAARQPITP
jgi:hypothetical protein